REIGERERSRDERQIRGDDRLAVVCAQLIGPHLSYTTRQAFLPSLYSPDDYRRTESVQAPHPYHYMYQHLSSGINYDSFVWEQMDFTLYARLTVMDSLLGILLHKGEGRMRMLGRLTWWSKTIFHRRQCSTISATVAGGGLRWRAEAAVVMATTDLSNYICVHINNRSWTIVCYKTYHGGPLISRWLLELFKNPPILNVHQTTGNRANTVRIRGFLQVPSSSNFNFVQRDYFRALGYSIYNFMLVDLFRHTVLPEDQVDEPRRYTRPLHISTRITTFATKTSHGVIE
ncbi:hypothetical protein M8C21_021857, partial [Ambrosia artemisiifolia]